ncbi:carboxylesterase/lipase family protein [Microbacterium sp. P5_E9]
MKLREIQSIQGTLRGVEADGVFTLLGVPYGDDTSGPHRFRAPRPVPSWSGVREAVTFGPAAPQLDSRGELEKLMHPRNGSPLEGGPMDEDCLRMNVWAPSGREGAELPVLVWLHGGGHLAGSGNEMWFNGDVLAARGDVVVVTVTHRLGLFGFLDLRDQGYPDSAHAGMLDIIAALGWVSENIASVGGDPSRVTIAGQSGGSGKVAALLAMPAARDLFVRAIMMSGPFARVLPQNAVTGFRDRVFEALGGPSPDALENLSAADLLAAQGRALAGGADVFGPQAMESMAGIGPVLDRVHLPEHPFWPTGGVGLRGKQLLIGWTAHEVGSLLASDPGYTIQLTADDVVARLTAFGIPDPQALFDATSATVPSEPPHLVYARLLSGMLFAGPAREVATRARETADEVWVYEFAEPSDALGGLLGSCHSLDIAYVFGTVDRIPLVGATPARVDLSRRMMNAWVGFATSGAPAPVEEWRPWGSGGESMHRFSATR